MSDMVLITRVTGAVLIVIGVAGYAITAGASLTALLPTVLGLPVLGLGVWAGDETRRRTAIHAALVLALLGFLGTLMNVVQLPAVLSGGEVARPQAVVVSSLTALVCAVYLGVGVRSFVAARRGDS
jgi:multisubunit Na+/H+ antiporter MnhF subunit